MKEDFKIGLRRRYLAVFDEVVRDKGVTDKEICRVIGIAATQVSQMRSGNRFPTTEQVMDLCDAFGYDLAFIIRGKDKKADRLPADGVTLEDVYKELQEVKQALSGAKGKK
ncbi:hypothetical protein Cpin_3876 [Chitinophaga pinensis DSM 2588]|uniref:HTH cro/C1-type domain-containing protein n=2 Tax=Chitinophaga pinensis TaxID=79329 RepID=A0A979GSC8_CHIPD|nr:hypothetical protein Cpin_3876 [Chitinophaga pinensis DSM 2588]